MRSRASPASISPCRRGARRRRRNEWRPDILPRRASPIDSAVFMQQSRRSRGNGPKQAMTGSPIVRFQGEPASVPMAGAPLRHALEEFALVADIGGTNARFALAPLGDTSRAIHEQHRPVNAFDSFAQAADAYLKEYAPGGGIRFGMVAVASPATGDSIKITNSAWHFSLEET